MRAAFVVVVPRGGRGLPPHVTALLEDGKPAELPFAPGAHVRWSSAPGDVHAAAWQEAPAGGGTCWDHAEGGLAVVAGSVRRRGAPWGPPGTWPGVVRHALVDSGVEGLDGLYAAAVLGDDGVGRVLADPLGLAFVHVAEARGLVVVASHAALAAAAIAPPRAAPRRDALAAAWFAFARHWVGDRSGYEGVATLPPGATVAIEPGAAAVRTDGVGWWRPPGGEGSAAVDDVAPGILASVGDAVARLATYPAPDHAVDLTGGRDSRLMLAGAVHAGVVGDLTFATVGGARVQDAVVAGELAALVGAEHRSGVPEGRPAGTYAQRTAWFVEATGGMASTWRLRWPGLDPPATVHANGLLGEPLRREAVPWLPTDRQQVLDHVLARANALGLVRPDAAAWHREQLASWLLDDDRLPGTPADLPDIQRMVWLTRHGFGPRVQVGGHPTTYPLYDARSIRAAFAVGPVARRRQLLHRRCLRLADPRLEAHRLVGPPWPPDHDDDVAPPRWLREGRPPDRVGRPVARAGKVAGSVVFGAPVEEIRASLVSVLSRPGPAWEVLDQAAALAAAARYEDLTGAERQELHGAATAAQWLGEDGLGGGGTP